MDREVTKWEKEEVPGNKRSLLAIFRPTPSFIGRTCHIRVFNRGISVSASALGGVLYMNLSPSDCHLL